MKTKRTTIINGGSIFPSFIITYAPMETKHYSVRQTPGRGWYSVWNGETCIADVLTESEARIIAAAPDMVNALIDVACNCNDTISREAAKRVLNKVGIEL